MDHGREPGGGAPEAAQSQSAFIPPYGRAPGLKDKAEERFNKGLVCPLDEIDAASRVLDLIYSKSTEFGKFFKDYREIPW
jgi:hypothetical protein